MVGMPVRSAVIQPMDIEFVACKAPMPFGWPEGSGFPQFRVGRQMARPIHVGGAAEVSHMFFCVTGLLMIFRAVTSGFPSGV